MQNHEQQARVTVHNETPKLFEPPVVTDLSKLTDARGRELVVKAPDILMQARFERLFGADNDNYRLIMGAVTWVRSIDGEAVIQPASVLAYEALLQRVGEQALQLLVARIAKIQEDDDGDDERGAVKNS